MTPGAFYSADIYQPALFSLFASSFYAYQRYRLIGLFVLIVPPHMTDMRNPISVCVTQRSNNGMKPVHYSVKHHFQLHINCSDQEYLLSCWLNEDIKSYHQTGLCGICEPFSNISLDFPISDATCLQTQLQVAAHSQDAICRCPAVAVVWVYILGPSYRYSVACLAPRCFRLLLSSGR